MAIQETGRIRLLMVDDEEEFLVSSIRALSNRGIDAFMAFDGAMALKTLNENEVDVVTLDIKMPGMDGIELFHRIQERYPDLPVILLTGHGSIPQAFETSKEGVFDYLTKPCKIDTLVKTIKAAASQSEQRKDSVDRTGVTSWSGEQIQVMIVDDEVELLESLKKVLQRRKMTVTTVQNGKEALKRMKESIIEVVVLDVKMPGMDGMEVLDRIKKESPSVEVILLTGHPTIDTALTGMKQGAFDYVVKPPDIDDLTDAIRKANEQREVNIIEKQQKIISEISERYPD